MMVKGVRFVFVNVFIVIIFYSVVNFASPKKHTTQQENQAPVVKILTPKNNSPFDWNTQLNYTISVSDNEDGESKYDEINPKEVLLKVRYAGDGSKITAELNKKDEGNSPGLTAIRTSNCFNCHNFDSKLIGPSFMDISKRYTATPANITLMVKRTREGSAGVWGKVTMPTHSELTKEETQTMVEWILKNGAKPNVSYYIGTSGSFRLKQPVGSTKKAAYILTASYIDHGAKETAKGRLSGQDVIVINSK